MHRSPRCENTETGSCDIKIILMWTSSSRIKVTVGEETVVLHHLGTENQRDRQTEKPLHST